MLLDCPTIAPGCCSTPLTNNPSELGKQFTPTPLTVGSIIKIATPLANALVIVLVPDNASAYVIVNV